MALNAATIRAAVEAAVAAEFPNQFPEVDPPDTTTDIADALAALFGEMSDVIIAAMKTDADLTGVTSGSDTVAGGVD